MSKLIESWNNRGVFDQLNFPISIETNLDDNVISRAYGLIKVHKKGMPARIIVSSLNNPTYKFDKFIFGRFNEFIPRFKYSPKDGLEFKKSLDNLIIPENYKLISLDVVSLCMH